MMKLASKNKRAKASGVNISLDELIALRLQSKAINLMSHKRVFTQQAGAYISGFRGRGIEFEENRVYQAGDDIRLMDWRVTARTGVPHTKVFREERERPVYLVVDLSASMYFGTKVAFKSVLAAKVAALLAWAACDNGDRIGTLVFSGNDHVESRPRSRKFGVLPLLHNLSDQCSDSKPGQADDALAKALTRLRRVARPGSLVFLISDFDSLNKNCDVHLSQLSQHCETVAIRIMDVLEHAPPPPGHYSISDGQQFHILNTEQRDVLQAYQHYCDSKYQLLDKYIHDKQISLIELATDCDVVASLQTGLLTR